MSFFLMSLVVSAGIDHVVYPETLGLVVCVLQLLYIISCSRYRIYHMQYVATQSYT